MKSRLFLLSLMLGLFAAAPSKGVWACNGGDGDHETRYHTNQRAESCCADEVENSGHCSAESDACTQTHPDQPCPEDERGHCHCPGCGTVACGTPGAVTGETTAMLPFLPAGASSARQAFYFADHLPEAVYFPIWQPPKLRA